ncbi:helix-turn-helix domain-containing protein [Burkholderiaceae bacterium DAT-1]|nr:helix-turn-helix domain-containing protein [Burkholderiaceae bacterium DAT-1]
MTIIALLLSGFSIFSAALLWVTHLRQMHPAHAVSRWAGYAFFAALAALQLAHAGWLSGECMWLQTVYYRMMLFVVAPAAWLWIRPFVLPDAPTFTAQHIALHALPVLLPCLLPSSQATAAAFVLGAGYLLSVGRWLYALRAQRAGFHLEVAVLGTIFAIALCVAAVGWMPAMFVSRAFVSLYAIAIGCAFFLGQWMLGVRPQLPEEVEEVAREVSPQNTLRQVDCEAALGRLDYLMKDEHLYVDPDLSLSMLANRLALSTHQASALLNQRLGKGFARYVREFRVMAAKDMLVQQPGASVLSVGLSVGFTSQSTFYEAFRELEGCTPGHYRQSSLKK